MLSSVLIHEGKHFEYKSQTLKFLCSKEYSSFLTIFKAYLLNSDKVAYKKLMSDASTLKFAHGKGMSIGIYVCKLLASGLRPTYMVDYDKFNSECIKLDMELSKFVDYFRRGELKSLGLQDTGWEKIKKTLAL